jgi:methionyl aminopeptidase
MINTKTESEISLMSYAGKVAFELLNELESKIKPGVTTKELDSFAETFIKNKSCTPATKGYEGYPGSICTSINEEVVHGIPSERALKNGDIITIDVVVCYKGYNADTARTYKVGKVSEEIENLMKYTKEALYKGLSVIKEGVKLNEICKTIESVAKEHNYGVPREIGGHGIGASMHEDPFVMNYENDESELILKSGMTLAIEPMFSLKGRKVWLLDDDWTISTQDGSPVAHYEHTIVVTSDGYKILTGE